MTREEGIHSGSRNRTSRPSATGVADGAGRGVEDEVGDAVGAGKGDSVRAGASDVWLILIHAEKGGFLARTQSSFVSATEIMVPAGILTVASPRGVFVERSTDSRTVTGD